MKIHRFYSTVELPSHSFVLTDERITFQVHTVLRLTSGELIDLFTPSGQSARYTIGHTTKTSLALDFVQKLESPQTLLKLRVCLALLKKDNFELAVAKLTEIGVEEIVPILSARTEKKNTDHARLERIAIESSEQSGRTKLPRIEVVMTLTEALGKAQGEKIYFGSLVQGSKIQNPQVSRATLFVGPEGGWTDNEEKLLKESGAEPVSFGTTTLKAETAALVLASIILNQ